MADLFRDTAVGQLLHLLSRGRICRYHDIADDKLASCLSNELTGTETLSRWSTTRNSNFRDLENAAGLRQTLSKRSNQLPVPLPDSASTSERQLGPEKLKQRLRLNIVTWDGSRDPANPQNWSLFKKCFVTFLICLLTFSVYTGSAIYTAGLPGVQEQFGVSQVVAVLGLTLFVFGYGLGPMFLAPFAETPSIGRSPVYILTLAAFVFLNFGVIYATNIGMLLAFRFLTGFFGSPVLATGGASMADMWSEKKRAYAIGVWGIFAVLGPSMGPLIGGFAAENKGWKWTLWELVWLNGFCLVLLAFTLPETSSATILYKRAQRLRKTKTDPSFKSESEIEAESISTRDLVNEGLWRPFQLAFREPILMALNVYLGLIYALLYTWFEAFPIAFIETYGFSLGTQGLAFLGILVGCLIVCIPYFYWLRVVQEKQFDEGTMTPEKRLPPAIIGSFLIPICLFWFGWSVKPSVHWIVPIMGSSLFSMGAVLLFNAILNYQGDAYPKYVGSVLAGNDLMRSGMGGAFPLFATAMFNNLGLNWGCSLLGFLAIAFIPIPIFLWKYGRRIRMASKYARHDI